MTVTKGTVSGGDAYTAIPTPSATQQNNRDVFDKIIMNFAQNAPLLICIAKGDFDGTNMVQSKGLISKRKVTNIRYEVYNHNPISLSSVVGAGVISDTNLLACDTTYIKAGDTLMNPDANMVTCRVDSVVSSGTDGTCRITSFGSTAFSVTAGDTLLIGATAYGQNSSNPAIMSKDFDNIFNTTQISREPVASSATLMATEFYGTTDYHALLKKINLINFLRKWEHTWLFGQKSASNNTTAGGAVLTAAFSTTKGAWNFAANTYNMGGNISFFKWRSEIPQVLTTVSGNDTLMCLCGAGTLGRVNDLMNAQAQYQVTGTESNLKKFGLKTRILTTNGPDIEFVHHPAFDIGALQKKAFLFKPDMNGFAFLNGRDIQPRLNIQANDLDGKVDEVFCECGYDNYDGGVSSCIVENIW